VVCVRQGFVCLFYQLLAFVCVSPVSVLAPRPTRTWLVWRTTPVAPGSCVGLWDSSFLDGGYGPLRCIFSSKEVIFPFFVFGLPVDRLGLRTSGGLFDGLHSALRGGGFSGRHFSSRLVHLTLLALCSAFGHLPFLTSFQVCVGLMVLLRHRPSTSTPIFLCVCHELSLLSTSRFSVMVVCLGFREVEFCRPAAFTLSISVLFNSQDRLVFRS